jgi:hypothetical protein
LNFYAFYKSTAHLQALPTLALWISKIASSWLNTWLQGHTEWGVSYISKVLNGIGSVGLALFMLGATFLDSSRASLAVVFLCFSMFFTGLHTPGCQAALVAVAPAFSGAITGLTFFFVAISGMVRIEWIRLKWPRQLYLEISYLMIIPNIHQHSYSYILKPS